MKQIIVGFFAGMIVAAIFVLLQNYQGKQRADDNVLSAAPVFKQPGAGDSLSIRLKSGRIVRGEIADLRGDAILIATENGEISLKRDEISIESRALLFKEDFESSSGTNRPSVISNAELLKRLAGGEESAADLGLGPNIQYVIMGDRSIFFYYVAKE